MFSFTTSISLALLAISSVSGLALPRRATPAGWATGYLEDYTVYHTRYLALDCQDKHNSPFFDQCCHPLLANENLKDARPPQCIPSATASSSAAKIEPTSTVPTPDDPTDDGCDCADDEECVPDDEPPSTPAQSPAPKDSPTPTPPASTPTPKASQSPDAPKPAPAAPSPSPKASPNPKPAPAPAANPPTNGNVNTGGFATFFDQNGVAGACGKVHSDSDHVCALDKDRYGDLGKQSPDCGRTIRLTNTQNGKSTTCIVADACPTCENSNSLDLSRGAFNSIAAEATGMVPITWSFV